MEMEPLGAGLNDDHAKRVRDDVVQLASDPRSLLGYGQPCSLLPLLFELACPRRELSCEDVTGTDGAANRPEAGQDHRYEDDLAALMLEDDPKIDRDDQAHTAHNRRASACMSGHRVGGDHPDDEWRRGRMRRRRDNDLNDRGRGDCRRHPKRCLPSPYQRDAHDQRRHRDRKARRLKIRRLDRPYLDLGHQSQGCGESHVTMTRKERSARDKAVHLHRD